MPRKILDDEFQPILDLITRHPGGIGIEGLLKDIGPALPRRTLQRRLATLVAQQRVQTTGEGRALKYRLAEIVGTLASQEAGDDEASATGETYVPLSAVEAAVKAYVRQPCQQRKPVGYQIGSLERYDPNRTAYLPVDLRAQLHSMGRSPAEQATAGTFARDILNRLFIDLSWASSRLEGNTHGR